MTPNLSLSKPPSFFQIFLVLYFWYVLLFALSAFYIVYRISTIALPQLRTLVLKVKINERPWGQQGTPVSVVLRQCDIGDWFLLEQIGQNVNSLFFRYEIWDYKNLGVINRKTTITSTHNTSY